MGVEIKLSDNELPVSPVFVDFLVLGLFLPIVDLTLDRVRLEGARCARGIAKPNTLTSWYRAYSVINWKGFPCSR